MYCICKQEGSGEFDIVPLKKRKKRQSEGISTDEPDGHSLYSLSGEEGQEIDSLVPRLYGVLAFVFAGIYTPIMGILLGIKLS